MPSTINRFNGTAWVEIADFDEIEARLLASIKDTGGTMTGPLFLPAVQDLGATAAINKGFADATYVNVGGDTMTGTLTVTALTAASLAVSGTVVLSSTGDASLTSTAHPFQIGLTNANNVIFDNNEIQSRLNGAATGLSINLSGGAVGIGPGGLTTTLLTATGTTWVNNGDAETLKLTGSATGGYIGFYESTTRRGYVGHYPDGHMSLTADTGYVYIRTGGGYILFQDGGTERMRMDSSGDFLVGHTSAGTIETGAEIRGSSGMVASWVGALNGVNLWLSRYSSAAVNDQTFVTLRNSSTQIGRISMYGTTEVAYQSTSDYRLKDVLGLVERPLERLNLLRPWHVRWKAGGMEKDSFLAHEVAEVAPYAVTGEKDAVLSDDDEHDPGGIDPQQLDASKLIPLLTAAIQEQQQIIEALTAHVTILEAA